VLLVQPSRPPLLVQGKTYTRDSYSNATPTILSKVGQNLHLQPSHPLSILRSRIEAHFPSFQHLNSLSPIVTVQQNFDDLGFPRDHPGRSLTDSYYLNQREMLRTHTSAHEVELFKAGVEQFLLTADVYRRDEIDRSHYPVFHQMEGANVVTRGPGLERLQKENEEMRQKLESANIVITDPTRETTTTNPIQEEHHTEEEARIISDHLKNSLNTLVLRLFGGLRKQGDEEPLQVRWIEATFPWTAPSYEVEVLYEGKWLEILGCGVVKQDALNRSGELSPSFSSLSL
jgi:phenylalanyl-tRNA synthetase alpha chain